MALSIDFNICLDTACSEFNFTETTGLYSATNTGGWGTPNADIGDIVTALLQVTGPDGTPYTINLLTESFPSSNSSFSYEFLTSVVGDYEDGAWQFLLYYVDDSGTVYQKKHNYLFYCNTACCVETMLANIEVGECDNCNDIAKIDTYLKVKVFLDTLKYAAKCYQVSNFTSIKSILDKLCVNSGCRSCN